MNAERKVQDQESLDRLIEENAFLRSALEKADLANELLRQREEFSQLLAVSKHIVSELDLDTVFQMVANKARDLVQADMLLVPMLNEQRDRYTYKAAVGPDAEAVLEASLPITIGMCGWVLQNERSLLFGESSPCWLDETTAWEKGQESAVLVPLFGRKRIIGGLSALGKKGGGSFTPHDLDLLTMFANQVSTAIENATLFQQVQREVEERTQAEKIIARQVGDLEQKNTELERFTYTVSHDLKSPLVTIKGFLGLLLADARAGNFDRMQTDINRIESAADKMQFLLDDLLKLSRIGRVANPPTDFSLNEPAQEAVELLHGSIHQAGAEIVIHPDMPRVSADKQRIREMLQNLIENAIKFRSSGSALRIEIGCMAREGAAVYFVKDNGKGIEPKFHERIFGLFDKLDPASPGTGIGLALVKRIVELHNGRIWVESGGPGQGSVFCFTLPAATTGERSRS